MADYGGESPYGSSSLPSDPDRIHNMKPPLSPPFENFTFRSREEVMAENDSDASYDTDDERGRFEAELLKDEFPECYKPIPHGVPRSCYCCNDPLVIRTDNGRKVLECETKRAGFVRHYCRWWDEAIVEELQDRKIEIRQLKDMVSALEREIQQMKN